MKSFFFPRLRKAKQERDHAVRQFQEVLAQRDSLAHAARVYEEHVDRLDHRLAVRDKRRALRKATSHRGVGPRPASRDLMVIAQQLGGSRDADLGALLADHLLPRQIVSFDLRPRRTSALGTWSPADLVEVLMRSSPDEVADLRAMWGRWPQHIHRYLPKPAAYMTVLHDPAKGIRSRIAHIRSESTPIASADLMGGARQEVQQLDNPMTRIISGVVELDPADAYVGSGNASLVNGEHARMAEEALDRYFIVGTDERFDETLVLLASELGWALSDVARLGQKTAAASVHHDFDDAFVSEILPWNRYDAALYEKARRLLERQIEQYCGDFYRDLTILRDLKERHRSGVGIKDLRRAELSALA